jgi:hypothetical protein
MGEVVNMLNKVESINARWELAAKWVAKIVYMYVEITDH